MPHLIEARYYQNSKTFLLDGRLSCGHRYVVWNKAASRIQITVDRPRGPRQLICFACRGGTSLRYQKADAFLAKAGTLEVEWWDVHKWYQKD